jgi:hypothetical protein
MKLAARLSKLLVALRASGATSRSDVAALPAPLIVALEPRIVYDASAASIGMAAAAAQHHDAGADTHNGASPLAAVSVSAASARTADAPASARAVHGDTATLPNAGAAVRAVQGYSDVMGASTDKQVVFVNSNVTDYQTLVAGLPQGTQVVILDSTKDGLAQIEQYLQQHQGVSAIHLVSHGSDGNVQIGSTWLNEGDLPAYSAELSQIGAAMKPGGDFLIYGCDVAQNADGKALVQQIASISGLNVAASTDATGAAALGGDWTLEYQAGTVHTPVIFSTAAEQRYGEVLAVTDETYDTQIGYVTPGGATGVTSFSLDGITYTMDQPSEFAVDSTTVNQFGAPPLSTGSTDGVLVGNVQGGPLKSVTMSLTNGDRMTVQSLDIDISTPSKVSLEALDASGNVVGTYPLDSTSGTSSFVVDLSSNPAFAGIKSFRIIETDSNSLFPTLNNFTYVDLPLQVTTDSGSAAFVAGDNATSTPVAIDSGLTVSDSAVGTLSSATVAITGGFQSGEDALSFTNDGVTMGNITSTYNAATGVMTLTSSSSSATLAQWQSALRSVKYTDTVVTPNNATRTVSFTAVDSAGNTSITATRTVTVTDTDQTPIVRTTGGTTNYVGASSAVTIDGGVAVSDLDNTTQSAGSVSISSGFHSGDSLAFSNTNSTTFGNISGSYNSATGVLTLTSSGALATDAQWANALKAVTFSSTSTTYGSRTISFSTSDGTKTSAAASDTINMTAPPAITTDSGSAAFVAGDNTTSTPVAVDSGLTVTDGSAATLSQVTVAITGGFQSGKDELSFTNDGVTMGNIAEQSYNSATGVMTLTSSSASATLAQWQSALQSVTFTNTAVTPDNTTRTIGFTATDGAGNTSATATRTVTVTDTDQTPIVTTTGGTTNYVGASSAVTIDGHVTVSDRDNSTQTSATVAVTTGFQSGDVLSFTNDGVTMGNIQASYTAGTGVMLLTSIGGSATNAQWASALSSVTFSSTSTTYGNRTIWYQVNDGTKNSVQAADTINMTAPPAITTDSGSAAFVAGDNTASTPVAVDSGLTVTDGSAATLSQVTVAITGGFQSGKDVLSFTNDGVTMGNIAEQSYNSATGVMTLTSSSASATLAQWQSALQSVTFTNTAVTPDNTTRTIGFTATDGAGNTSATATRTVTVTDTDQTPIVTTTGGTTNYVGGTSAATIDGHVTVSDRDNTTQASATVSISAGFHSGDTLTFVNSNSATFGNIVGSYNASTGVLTLTSSGAVSNDAQWSNALSAVTFSAGSSATPGNRTISFATNDGTKTSAVATDTVDLLGPPTITTDAGAASFVAGDNVASTPVAIDSGLTLTDGVSPTLASVTVSITGGFRSGEDVLAFTNTNTTTFGNISVQSYNAATGVLTLTSSGATATLAQWQAALDAVTYTDTAVTPDTTTRTIAFAAVDSGAITSNTATRTVTVTDTDQTPIVTTTGGTTNYVGASPAVTIDGGISVSDRDNATQSIGTVSIGTGFNSGDRLSYTNTSSVSFGNIVGSYNATTGVLTLTSPGALATDAQWANALKAVTFSTTSTTLGNRTISFTTDDGTKTSAVANDTVAVLDRPHVALDPGAASFVAADNATSTPVTVAPGLTLTDATSSTFSASVSITGGFHQGQDVLALATNNAAMGDIGATYDANSGVLTLTSRSGNATRAQWQAALAGITYTDTAITPDTTTRVISFTVKDGNGAASAVQTRSVTVADTDQTPLLSVSGGVTFTARGNGSTPVAVAPQVTITDADNTTLTSAQVAISGGFDAAHDTLSFTGSAATGNIAVSSYDAATGVLTLTSAGGTATIAQWAAALQSVTYSDSSQSAGSSRTISFTVSDGVKSSAVASNTVTIANAPSFPPIVPAAAPVIVNTPASSHSSIFSDDTSPPDVLDEFDRPMPIGSVPIVQTMTFTDPNAPANMRSLDHAAVSRFDQTALDAALAPRSSDAQSLLPDMSFTMAPNDPFSIDVATLLPPSAALQGGTDVTVRLADGRTLPGWIRYDAAHGVLRGKLPAGVENVRIVVQTRDASGHETRREIVLAPRDSHAGHGDSHGASHGVAHPKPPGHAALSEPSVARAARPVGKPSLDRQFAQARAALHVSHPRVAPRRA